MVERCPDKTEVEGPIPSTRTVSLTNAWERVACATRVKESESFSLQTRTCPRLPKRYTVHVMEDSFWLLRDKYNGVPSADFARDVQLLESGVPLAYVIGWVPFLDAKIYLDSKPLIPRPETEYWTAVAIKELQSSSLKNPKVLDLCAGSGCVGIAVAKKIPDAEVHFIEIDPAHHSTIRKNILENDIDEKRTRILGGDLFEYAENNYDMILANPPYIATALSSRVDQNVLAHEPKQALWAGEDGMNFIKKIIDLAPKYLSKNGVLYIEHEPEQVEKIQALNPQIKTFEDQFGIMRFSRLENN